MIGPNVHAQPRKCDGWHRLRWEVGGDECMGVWGDGGVGPPVAVRQPGEAATVATSALRPGGNARANGRCHWTGGEVLM